MGFAEDMYERPMCSLTTMDGLGAEILLTRITGVKEQDYKGWLERGCIGLSDVSDNVSIERI